MRNYFLTLMLMMSVFGAVSNTAAAQSVPAPIYNYSTVDRFQSYINLATAMRDYVTPEVYSKIYIPLRMKAVKAKITLRNYGALSATSQKTIMDLVKFVHENEESFDQLWEVEIYFSVAEDLMEMTQALSRDLE